jgi:hypothetical protein
MSRSPHLHRATGSQGDRHRVFERINSQGPHRQHSQFVAPPTITVHPKQCSFQTGCRRTWRGLPKAARTRSTIKPQLYFNKRRGQTRSLCIPRGATSKWNPLAAILRQPCSTASRRLLDYARMWRTSRVRLP